MSETQTGFDEIKQRLEEIVDQVSRDDIALDDALTLYEEAVKLGIAACDASELDVKAAEAEVGDEAQTQSALKGAEASEGAKEVHTTQPASENLASGEDAEAKTPNEIQAEPVEEV